MESIYIFDFVIGIAVLAGSSRAPTLRLLRQVPRIKIVEQPPAQSFPGY
jgi:hypothetical protein